MADTTSTVATVAKAAAVVGGVIANIVDAKKQREFQEKFAKYTADQQVLLADQIQAAQTETDRLAVLTTSITNYDIAQAKIASRKDNITYIVMGGLAVILLTTAIIISVKNKSN